MKIVALLAWILNSIPMAEACTYAIDSVDDRYRSSDLIIVGSVKGVEKLLKPREVGEPVGKADSLIRVLVAEVLKGDAKIGSEVSIYFRSPGDQARNGIGCPMGTYSFSRRSKAESEDFLLFALQGKGAYFTHALMGNLIAVSQKAQNELEVLRYHRRKANRGARKEN